MRIRIALVVVSVVLAVAGCGGSDPDKRPSAAPTEPSAVRALKALQASVADFGAVEISGGTSGSPRVGRRIGTSDLRTGDFSASITLGNGLIMKMLRHADLTWTMAPPVYWNGIGYTRASARAARGRWVVGPVASVAPMIEAMDPGAVVRSVLTLTAANLVGVAPVTRGRFRGDRVLTFTGPGTTQRIYFTASEKPRLVRVTSTKGGATTWVDFVAFPRQFQVRLPRAHDVFQGR